MYTLLAISKSPRMSTIQYMKTNYLTTKPITLRKLRKNEVACLSVFVKAEHGWKGNGGENGK
jgi:hypothetical protein